MNTAKKINYMFLMGIFFFLNNGNALGSSIVDKGAMSQKMQENILRSPFKALLHRSDGKKIMAYLYAEDEQRELEEDISRIDGKSYTTMASIGHFHIYLYDVDQGAFLPGKTSIFKAHEIAFNSEGAEILVLSGKQGGKSDVLLISQFATGEGDVYEAYGFSPDNSSFKHYIFNNDMKEKESQFYGTIVNDEKKNKMIAYTVHQKYEIGGFEIVDVDISLSKNPGEIDMRYLD
jgi:hypothetical protein